MAISHGGWGLSRAVGFSLAVTGVLVLALGPGAVASTRKPPLSWVARYDGPGHGLDVATAVASSPTGSAVFVTGYSRGAGTNDDYATVAYDAATGTRLWLRRYNGPGDGIDRAASVASSPGGSAVFVTGSSRGAGTNDDYATVAYDAATGKMLWLKRYDGPGNRGDGATSVVASPDGSKVFVTGGSTGIDAVYTDYATVAYDAATGTKLWVKRYGGPGNRGDFATSVATSPDGSTMFVTGASFGGNTGNDYATVAYEAANGNKLWVKRYNGPGGGDDASSAVAVASDASKVFVTGRSEESIDYPNADYATAAYDASTGARLWVRRYSGFGELHHDLASSLATAPDGSKVFVTGGSTGPNDNFDIVTIGYNAATGSTSWLSRYNGPADGSDFGNSIVPSPDGSKVFVTGYTTVSATYTNYATLAYDASSGAIRWSKRFSSAGAQEDRASSIAASPDGSRVFVTGFITRADYDFATVSYRVPQRR